MLRQCVPFLIISIAFQPLHSWAHNMAYWLHTPDTTLYDLAFAIFPALTKQMQIVSEIAFFIILFTAIGFFCLPMLQDNEDLFNRLAQHPDIQFDKLYKPARSLNIKKENAPDDSSPLALTSSLSSQELTTIDNEDIGDPNIMPIIEQHTSQQQLQLQPPLTSPIQHSSLSSISIHDPRVSRVVWNTDAAHGIPAPLYTVQILTRFLSTLMLAQGFRAMSFLMTGLPGPNYHCRPWSPVYVPPLNLHDIILRNDMLYSCGDLVFSSHTIFMTLCGLIYQKYGQKNKLKAAFWAFILLFCFLVVSARKHYSLDVFMACYTVPLIWMTYDLYCPDETPVEVALMELTRLRRKQAEIVDSVQDQQSYDVEAAPALQNQPQFSASNFDTEKLSPPSATSAGHFTLYSSNESNKYTIHSPNQQKPSSI